MKGFKGYYKNRSNYALPLKRIILCTFAVLLFIFFAPIKANAEVLIKQGDAGTFLTRSLETLRDLDYQSWTVVAYTEDLQHEKVILRIVGYPGKVRLDHPEDLEVHSGVKEWLLPDITLSNSKLAEDPREAAAEFDLAPLLLDLRNNRPLRLKLDGVFNELPIPPYVVSEWRSLLEPSLNQ